MFNVPSHLLVKRVFVEEAVSQSEGDFFSLDHFHYFQNYVDAGRSVLLPDLVPEVYWLIQSSPRSDVLQAVLVEKMMAPFS